MSSASAAVPAAGGAVTSATEHKVEHVVLKQQKSVAKPKHRKDYESPQFRIRHVEIKVDLYEKDTKVFARVVMYRATKGSSNLYLDGDNLRLQQVSIDGKELTFSRVCCDSSGAGGAVNGTCSAATGGASKLVYGFTADDAKLCIPGSLLPEKESVDFVVQSEVLIDPIENLQLMGLYKTGKLFCTQCEAEGFRRITYFLDRPDVMATYRVRVIGDKEACPVLLSNGNLVESGECADDKNRHFAVFDDPHPKPCYLFALVAGQLKSIKDSFATMSGRKVHLEIFSEPEDVNKLLWAMESIKKAMKWDEEAFGREYDLDVFNIVCAKDFNMGAMENKGLNVFNTALLLADEKTTTDAEFQRILNVVGHEYFHNWTGNRVTCRDWFQLTLKEGLTVFRDQQFTRNVASKSVKRIEDVIFLKTRQFAEDGGPMSHPIRPESYIAMDNFYTGTVYDKGAEVIRMYHTLLGEGGFRKGMDLYFKRHDGQAVTCDEFRAAMSDANDFDMTQFENWYLQNGTPLLEVLDGNYDAAQKTYTLKLRQSIPSVAKSPYLPLHIPVRLGLVGKNSKKDVLPDKSMVVELKKLEDTFVIKDVAEDCVLSILRDCSAPLRVSYAAQSDVDLSFLMAHDSDDFNRWEASQKLVTKILLARTEKLRGVTKANCKELVAKLEELPKIFTDAFQQCLIVDDKNDASLQAFTLCLPDEDALHLEMPRPVDHEAVHQACLSVRAELCKQFHDKLKTMYDTLSVKLLEKYGESRGVGVDRCLDQVMVGRRRLRNMMLYYLCGDADAEVAGELAFAHFEKANCMTDKLAGFKYVCGMDCKHTDAAIKKFYDDANGDALIVDKWFTIQALADRTDCLQRVKELQKHKDFNPKNPNRLRSLIFAFSRNSSKFHCRSGEGYELLRKVIVDVDKFNPQVAARACSCLINWKLLDATRQDIVKKELQCILDTVGLSNDTCEIASKGLNA
eukprot:GHVS01000816.1.p1 GENE.GHVS01000816.1~~GHVS01000816.1.p1  ORF type:complete len:963 (+),score=127.47 GHVS01000816.1:184-3072(+)